MSPSRAVPVHNRSGWDVDEEAVAEVCRRVRSRLEEPLPPLSVALVEDAAMIRLHERYYGEEGSTDVLAFPYDDEAEIVLNPSYHRTLEDPKARNERLVEVLVHALLHLAGFDHTRPDDGGVHRSRQRRLMRALRDGGLPVVLRRSPERANGGR